tara:strand:+ start:555 stop:920 length:366 start_codon:yes stop_codon:yes gene_type:complete
MRVKLSYTVDVEDVLKEAAKVLNLQAEDLQHSINLFTRVQKELQGGDEGTETPNTTKALEMIEEFRKALLSVDTRLEEVRQIVTGYEEYRRSLPADDEHLDAMFEPDVEAPAEEEESVDES